MKIIYLYETGEHSNHRLYGHKEVTDDYQVQSGETEVEPFKDTDNFWNGFNWVADLMPIYLYDKANGSFVGTKKVPRGTQLQLGETAVEPTQGLYEPKFDGNAWSGITKEEYDAKHPVETPKPTGTEVLLAQNVKDLASLQADHLSQQKLNASLMKDNAELKKQNETQATLNATLMKQIASLQQQVKAVSTTTTAQ